MSLTGTIRAAIAGVLMGSHSPAAGDGLLPAQTFAAETPAGAIGQEVTVTATITAINKTAGTVTIKGPQGNTETIKAKDPKHLDLVKAGDLVEISYARALAVTLDKPAKK